MSSLFISGCAYNITQGEHEDNQKYYERVNKVCEDKDELSIVTKNNRNYKAKNLVIADDTTRFINLEFNSLGKINTTDISQIEFEGTISSPFEGFILGGLAGGVVANFLSNPATGESGHWKIIPISIGIVIGGLIGIIYSIYYAGNLKIIMTK